MPHNVDDKVSWLPISATELANINDMSKENKNIETTSHAPLSGVSPRFWQCLKCEMKVKTNGKKPNYNCKSEILDKDCGMYWMNEINETSFNEG